MRSRVEIVADVAADGRPVLVRLRAEGQLAARATGPARVHLVGTAAGPLGGDTVEVVVQVRAGATVAVHGVAATLALPSRAGGWGQLATTLEVAEGGRLTYAPGPVVVCRDALVRTLTTVSISGTATADVTERIVLGRHGEPAGTWRGRLIADRDGSPLLRTTTSSAVAPAVGGGPPARAVVSRLLAGTPATAGADAGSTRGGAVRCPLPGGGVLISGLGVDLTAAQADADALTRQVAAAANGGSPDRPRPGRAIR